MARTIENMIPFEQFGDSGPTLHFLHANGYPPVAYRLFLENLAAQFKVLAMHMRPLWPEAQPEMLQDWLPLADDLDNFIDQQAASNNSPYPALVGAGHSVGATTTLRLALRKPELFRALILIDPVLFPPWMIYTWKAINRLGLAHHTPPLVRNTLRRRINFANRQAMFDNYRKKTIFKRLPDESLWAYVHSLACDLPQGGIKLCYSPQWEARIYMTGILGDLAIWRALPTLRLPVLLIRGELTNTFWPATARLFQCKLPGAHIVTVPETTHLLPLEKPEEIAEIIFARQTLTGML